MNDSSTAAKNQPSRERQGAHSVFSLGFFKRYWVHMRPYLLFISGIAGLTGMAQVPEPDMLHVVVAMFPLFFAYGMGQALTDAFQVDTDSISSPYRPLVKGEITKAGVILVSLAGLLAGVLVLVAINPWLLIPGLLAIAGLAAYTPFKRTWWGGPPWNSWIVALLPLMGRMIAPGFDPLGSGLWSRFGLTPMAWSMLAIFFAYANFVVGGYFKDVSADRATNYRTFQVRFGWAAAAIYGDVLSVLAALCTFLAARPVIFELGSAGIGSLAVLILAVLVNAIAQIRLHATRDEAKTHGPIGNIVRAFLLYCYAMVLAHQPGWWPFLAIYHGLFEATLWVRPEKSQI